MPKQLGQLCVANLLMKKSSNKDESINRRFTTVTDVGHLPCMKSRWLNLELCLEYKSNLELVKTGKESCLAAQHELLHTFEQKDFKCKKTAG